MSATLFTIEENDHNANWLVEMQRRRKAQDGTPTDLDLARGDALVLAGVKKYNPDQPRDPKGSETGGQWVADGSAAGGYRAGEVDQASVDRMVARRGFFSKMYGGFGSLSKNPVTGKLLNKQQKEAAIVLGHETRREHTAELLSAAERIENATSTDAMLFALGSQPEWFQGPSSALHEWEAAQRLGGGDLPPDMKKALAALADGQSMDDATVEAFRLRQLEAQADFRAKYGDDEVTVFRGVKGRQGTKVRDAFDNNVKDWMRERDEKLGPNKTFAQIDAYGYNPSYSVKLGVRALSSWTTSEYDASEFAGEKGAVLKTTVTYRDVWATSRWGVRGVIRYIEDSDEVVVLSSDKERDAEYIGGGHKPRRRAGGFSF